MDRTSFIAGALAALALAGCGGQETPVRVAAATATPEAAAGQRTAVAPTDGRLGPASRAGSDGGVVRLAPGGPPDLRPPADRDVREGIGAAAACPAPEVAPEAAAMPAVLTATLCLVNAERTDRGLARLTENPRLAVAARRYAADLVAGRYFSHTGRDGSDVADRLRRVGYMPRGSAWLVGENLAWGTGPLATPAAIVRAWMNSPGHRANMLNPRYREIGLGVVLGNPAGAEGTGATYATEFGTVLIASPKRTLRKRAARSARRARR